MSEELLNLDPSDIVVKENIRFALKPYRVERLAEQILQDGGVNTPIEVTETDEGYVLTAGHYRLAAVTKLNTEQKAGLTLPARVVPLESKAQRTLRQVSENNERENLSPMDRAIAMRKLIDAGVSKMDVRKAFAAPGGRKGLKVQPASNSHINMTLSFLEFPKDVQRRIHDGLIGSNAAYELTKYPRDKWQAILDRIEADRIKSIDKEESEEEKLLKSMKASETQEQEAAKIQAEYATVKETAEKAQAAADEKKAAIGPAFQATLAKGMNKEQKDVASKAFKSAQAELKAADEVANKAAKELAKLEDKKKDQAAKANAIKERLAAARANKPAKVAEVGKVAIKDVKQAAKKEAVTATSGKPVRLNSNEMKDAIKSLVILSGTKKPKTKAVGEAILFCFDGVITDGQLCLAVARLVGEEAMPKTKA